MSLMTATGIIIREKAIGLQICNGAWSSFRNKIISPQFVTIEKHIAIGEEL